jgi:hypothetical protein
LYKEKLLALDETWSQHQVHWTPVTTWWFCAFCHPYVALTVVVIVHEVYCLSATSSTSCCVGRQAIL